MKPLIFVCGLGRCGSSLTMQMLDAAGVPCIGTFPDYEVPEANHQPLAAQWLADREGHAIKVLDPHLTAIPRDVPGIALWLDRDPREQARSQEKFARLVAFGGAPANERTIKGWAKGLRDDRRVALASLRGRRVVCLQFEKLLLSPGCVAQIITNVLELAPEAVEAMRSAVRPRPAACAPDLAMELALVAEADRREAAHHA